MGRRQGSRKGLILAAFDLIIFDYDGVVADSELLNNAILVDLLTEIGATRARRWSWPRSQARSTS